jgi:hypothetical protein
MLHQGGLNEDSAAVGGRLSECNRTVVLVIISTYISVTYSYRAVTDTDSGNIIANNFS